MKRKVLFVDDDEKLLNGLKLALRKYRDELQVFTASSGAAGLAIIAQHEFDCVISDMKMCGMDGAEFLEQVKTQSPMSKRFVLSGQADNEHIIQALPITHQFLSKPCNADEIIFSLRRAFELDDLMVNPEFATLINSVNSLPCRPVVFSKITKAINNKNNDLVDIANIISEDIGLSSKVLQTINSAFFGRAQPVTNVTTAASYLGTNIIHNLVLLYESTKSFTLPDIPGFDMQSEYATALRVAETARLFFTDKKQQDDAYAASLLHRTGLLLLAQEMPEKLHLILHENKDLLFHEREIKHINITSGQVGAYLLGVWGLPSNIIQAIAYQHQPWAKDHDSFDISDCIYIAKNICETSHAEFDDHSWLTQLDPAFIAQKFINQQQLIQYRQRACQHDHKEASNG